MTRLGSVPPPNVLLFSPRLLPAVMFPVGGPPCFFPPLEDDRNCLPARSYCVDDVPMFYCCVACRSSVSSAHDQWWTRINAFTSA